MHNPPCRKGMPPTSARLPPSSSHFLPGALAGWVLSEISPLFLFLGCPCHTCSTYVSVQGSLCGPQQLSESLPSHHIPSSGYTTPGH